MNGYIKFDGAMIHRFFAIREKKSEGEAAPADMTGPGRDGLVQSVYCSRTIRYSFQGRTDPQIRLALKYV